MPLLVWALGCAIFVQGTSELMIAGLLPEMAADLGVSIPEAGLLISGFAVGMLVGAPVLATLTRRWPPRSTLLAFLGIFAVTHAVGALAPGYAVLLATRVIGAFVYAGFWAVAAGAAVRAVPAGARGRAMSIVAGGLTVAVLVGLPAGTAIGQELCWRAVFWIVAAGCAATMLAVARTVPAGRPEPAAGSGGLRAEARIVTRPPLLLAYATTALATAALLVSYSYLAPILTDATGLAPRWIPAVLALFGVGALLGITVGGRTADRHPFATLLTGLAVLVAGSLALAAWADLAAVAIPLVAALGLAGFGINPALQARVLNLAEDAPTLAAAVNVSAFNVGITAGPWLGGLAIESGAGYPAVGWIGAALGGLGLVTAAGAAYQLRVGQLRVGQLRGGSEPSSGSAGSVAGSPPTCSTFGIPERTR
jgi:DHA1 family chloramphenicol resistance protein-like MFS transporter